jgi:branched-chain amino acid transport system permease protein
VDRFLDALFLGLSSGAIYALVALGLVVVFRGTGDLNFAQGEMATLSAFITAIVAGSTIPLLHWVIPLWFATLVGMAFGFALGVSTEVVIVRPLKRRSPLAVFVALIALFLGINALTTGLWGAPPPEAIGSLFPNAPTDFVRVFDTVWRYRDIGNLVLTLLVSGLLFLLFQKTRFGLAMRAVASNPESGRLVGIPTGLVLAASWGIAGALAALAGTLFAAGQGQVTPILMFNVFVVASAAATLGGLDSPLGAVVAGLLIGIIENVAATFAPGWVGQEMKLAVALACIFVVLLVRPSGLFGSTKVERV